MPNSGSNQGRVSAPIKIFVISLTIITFIAFVIFMYLLFSKIFPSLQTASWDKQLIEVADRLKSEGLKEEAIEQYKTFLNGQKINPVMRAEVSHSIGELYQEKGNCRQALVWFFQAELADSKTAGKTGVNSKIDSCLQQVRSANAGGFK